MCEPDCNEMLLCLNVKCRCNICIYILENDKSKISKNKHEKCCLGEKEFSGEDTKEEDGKSWIFFQSNPDVRQD